MPRKHWTLLTRIVCVLYACNALPAPLPDEYNHGISRHRAKRTSSVTTVRDCSNPYNPYLPPTATDTTARINDLRKKMREIERRNIIAYIIPSEDSHDSEYIAKCHERRHWITGFDGSAGLAIVTHNQSALWTDGRYYLQAEQQLDCNWILMKSSEAETQKPWDWLIDVLPSGTIQEPILVAFDPTLISISAYNKYNKAFKSTQSAGVYIEMYSHEQNLIDIIWNDRPDCPNEPLFALDIKWTGEEWYDKVIDHREEMKKVGADIMVLHALDDTAWFFNLRGMDIPYNPVFFGYTIIEMEKTTLFVKNVEKLIVDDIHSHLLQDKNDQSAGCANIDNNHKCLHILEYDIFLPTLNNKSNESDFTKVWISTTASYGIYGNVPTMRQYSAAVPTQLMKAQKNKNEIEGMREGNIQDAVAMIEWMHWMEGAVVNAAGDIDKLSEISADKKVQEFRRKQPDFVMPSFGAISAFGPNGAVIHYSSTPDTNVAITDNNMYLLDSGGQYRCGATTDITRTMHYGEPEARHREAYTRVLQGAIDLSRSIFPEGTWGRDVDIHARQQLWNNGWNYKHGTGHGIGAMLNVHEGPQRIAYGYRAGEAALSPGMFTSDEPGYYEDHDYGVRIETVFMTTEAETPNNFDGKQYYTFEEVSFVPYEPKLIKYEMMTRQQIDWLNEYNRFTRERVGPRVEQVNPEAYIWLKERTEPIPFPVVTGSSTSCASNILILNIFLIISLCLK